MATSYVRTIASGSTAIFTAPASYFTQDHVYVYKDGVLLTVTTDYTWPTSSTIQLVAGNPVAGTVILAKRVTPTDPLVDFEPGNLSSDDLDTLAIQAMYLGQENREQGADFDARAWYTVALGTGGLITKGAEGTVPQFDASGNLIEGPSGAEIVAAESHADVAATALAVMLTRYLGGHASDAEATTAAGGSPATGVKYFNTADNAQRVYNGADWVDEAVPPAGSVDDTKLSAPLLALSQTKRTPKMFGAVGNDTGDDTAAILAALSDGPVIGDPGAVYRMTTQLVVSTTVDSFFDLNGATLHLAGAIGYPIRGVAPTFTTYTVSGFTAGSNTFSTTATPTGLAIGDEVFFNFSGPMQLRTVTNIVGSALTVDRPIDHTPAAGAVTLYKANWRPNFALMNGKIDGDATVGGLAYVDHAETQIWQDLELYNIDLSASGNILVPYHARTLLVDNCQFKDTKQVGQFVSGFYNENATIQNCSGFGDGFGLSLSFSGSANFISNNIAGRYMAGNTPPSTRGIKATFCQGGRVIGNTIRGYDSGVKVEDCGGMVIADNVLEWCQVSINLSNQNPSNRTVGHLVSGNNIRFNQGLSGAVYVADLAAIAHKVDGNLFFQSQGDCIRGDAPYVGITNNHLIQYGLADPTAHYPVILTGTAQSGLLDGNYAFSDSPSTALGYRVAATSSGLKIGHNYGNLPAERLYHTLPVPSADMDTFLPGGIIEKTFTVALTTAYANYVFPTAFPHGFLAFVGGVAIAGPGSTAGAVVSHETSGTSASQVRLAAEQAGSFRVTVRGY